MNSALEQRETKELIRKHAARLRAKKARILKKAKTAVPTVETPAKQQDTLARVIDMAGILETNYDEEVQHEEEPLEADNTDFDRTLDQVLIALETPSNSSSSDESTSSSSYSSSSDSETFGTTRTIVQNPFAKAIKNLPTLSSPEATATATVAPDELVLASPTTTPATALPNDKVVLSTPSKEGINGGHTIKRLSVTIKKLSEKVIRKFTSSSTSFAPTTTMSAKNISKDRSSSRSRNEKQDRFNKGRTGDASDGTNQDQQGQQPGASGQGQSGNGNGQENQSGKRPRDPPKIGNHDDTMGEDFEDEEMPGAKRPMTSIREKLTHVYTKRKKETREKRDEGRAKPSVAFRVDTSNAGEKVKDTTVPLLAPTKLADAPTLSLKDLVPEADRRQIEEQGQDESFRTDRIEFVVVEREVTPGEGDFAARPEDLEWEFPDRTMFDMIIGKAIDIYTEEDWDLIDYMSFSSVGWNTGVGLFAFGSDKLVQMEKFRNVIR